MINDNGYEIGDDEPVSIVYDPYYIDPYFPDPYNQMP